MATVIFRPAYFLRKLVVGVALLALPAMSASAQQLSLAIDSIEHTAFSAHDVNVVFDVFHSGVADIVVADLRVGDRQFHNVRLRCKAFQLDDIALACGEGILRYADESPPASPLAFSFNYRFADQKLNLTLHDADIATLARADKQLRALHPVGHFDLTLSADHKQVAFNIAIRELGFNTDDFSIAGEHIAGKVDGMAKLGGKDWQWRLEANWSGGDAFWSPWFRRAGVGMVANGVMTPEQIRVDQARITLDRLGSLTAGLTWDRKKALVARWGFVTEPLDLGVAVKEWVQPQLDAHALPAITATGTTRYAAEWADGGMQFFYAGIENASFTEGSGRLFLKDVNASVPWSRTSLTSAEVSVGGGMLDDFALGGFRVPIQLNGFDVAISHVGIPFLDGRAQIDDFHASRPQTEWTGHFSGGIEGVSMPRLTSAIKLPTMAGKLAMRIPAANYANHELDLSGDMNIDVFDGHITLRNLKLIEPFSKTSRFVTDVEARRLDLGLLTSTFSFGSITGLLDADIAGLELQDWKPLAFRARIGDSPGDYRRAISRGALIDISSLGGSAGAAAVRAIPAAGFFNTFRYDHIGLVCTLKAGICRMEGIAPVDGGYVLVEGSGIPAVKVMGYNRDVDWNLLVSRLKAVIAGKTKAVIE